MGLRISNQISRFTFQHFVHGDAEQVILNGSSFLNIRMKIILIHHHLNLCLSASIKASHLVDYKIVQTKRE